MAPMCFYSLRKYGRVKVRFIAKDHNTKTLCAITQIEIFPPVSCILGDVVGGQGGYWFPNWDSSSVLFN